MNKTILKKHQEKQESLSNLQDRESQWEYGDMGVARLRGLITNYSNWLIEHWGIVEKIQSCLQEQRPIRDERWFQRFRHDTDHRRRDTMEKQSAHPFYYIQRAFSLPKDYVFRRQDIDDPLDGIVFQPELIGEHIFQWMWLFTEDNLLPSFKGKTITEKAQLYEQQLSKKIELLPQFREILQNANPLELWDWSTGRILQLENGKYLVFQEQKRATEDMKRPDVQYISKIYGDMYSLMRAQEYGTEALSQDVEKFIEVWAKLDTLQMSWKLLSPQDKEEWKSEILGLLGDSRIPHIARARSRVNNITYQHAERDARSLQGASNDIKHFISSRQGKSSTIRRQWLSLTPRIRSEELRFEFLKKWFLQAVTQLPQEELDNFLKNDVPLALGTHKQMRDIFSVLDQYTQVIHDIGEPFIGFHRRIQSEIQKNTENPKEVLRSLFRITLGIKAQSYKLSLYQWYHRLKKWVSPKSFMGEIQETIVLLANRSFLAQYELTPSGRAKFDKMLLSLRELHQACETSSPTIVLKQIEDLLKLE